MAAFSELDWRRIDVHAIVECSGIATIDERRRSKCLDRLRRNGYEIESLDCTLGLVHAIPELGRILRWQQQFGYALDSGSRNLDALRDGFEFAVSEPGGKVFELVRADVAWQEDARWLLGLLAFAQEATRRQLALGKRFFTLLVLPETSPLIGQTIDTTTVPVMFWNPCTEVHEFDT
jgi:hypothetical protein